MEYVSRGGAEIPAIGMGTFQLQGESCERAVRTALELGYRHVDTAEYYDNEAAVGRALAEADVDRDDVFLTTKIWRSNLERGEARAAAEASLDRLGVEYVDLLLIHWPHPRVDVAETLADMEALRDEGRVRHLGVSNFTASGLADATAAADAPIVTDQVQYHPYVDQTELLERCRDLDVALTAYSPLARGRAVGDDTLARIGRRHDVTAAQVALRWLVQQDGVVAIPRSSSRDHLAANLEVFEFELDDAEMKTVHDRSAGLKMRLQNALPSLMRSFPL